MKTLSIVVPVYNEALQLEEVLRYFFSLPYPLETQWIVVDDCSTDATGSILNRLQKEFSFTLLTLPKNQGKGRAIREGIQEARGDYLLIQDADFEYDPRDIPALLEPLLSGQADVVYGSRFKKNNVQVPRTYHYFVNRFLTALSNLFSGMYLTDMETCYKLFKRDLLQAMNLRSQRFGIEVELTAYVAKTSARVFEIPIRYYPRTRLQGKKISWRDGIAALRHLVYFNWCISLEKAFRSLPLRYSPQVLPRPTGSLQEESSPI